MEIQQEIVTSIEKLIEASKAISLAKMQTDAFFSEPHSKLEITEFLKTGLGKQLYPDGNFTALYMKLIPGSSKFNTDLTMRTVRYGNENADFWPGKMFGIEYKQLITKFLTYLDEIQVEIEKMTYDDVVDRGIALRKAYPRLYWILSGYCEIETTEETMLTLNLDDQYLNDYMTLPISEMKSKVEDSEYVIGRYRFIDEWCDDRVHNRLRSLMMFVIYLGSLVRY